MKHRAWLALVLLTGLSQAAPAAQDQLTDQQKLGRQLYEKSCGICHTRPTLTAGLYGPELSKISAGGQDEVMRQVITEGTPRMPAFKYSYDADQIAAIAAYLMTLSPGHQTVTPPHR